MRNKKLNYTETREFALSRGIKTRDEWFALTKTKDFPKNIYKRPDSAFSREDGWLGYTTFLMNEDGTAKVTEESMSFLIYSIHDDLIDLLKSIKKYSKLELGEYDDNNIRNYITSVETLYSRDIINLDLDNIIENFSKKNYLGKRSKFLDANEVKNISIWTSETYYKTGDLIKDPESNNIYVVIDDHKSLGKAPIATNRYSGKYELMFWESIGVTPDNEFLNLERIFLIYSIILMRLAKVNIDKSYQSRNNKLDIMMEKFNLLDLPSDYIFRKDKNDYIYREDSTVVKKDLSFSGENTEFRYSNEYLKLLKKEFSDANNENFNNSECIEFLLMMTSADSSAFGPSKSPFRWKDLLLKEGYLKKNDPSYIDYCNGKYLNHLTKSNIKLLDDYKTLEYFIDQYFIINNTENSHISKAMALLEALTKKTTEINKIFYNKLSQFDISDKQKRGLAGYYLNQIIKYINFDFSPCSGSEMKKDQFLFELMTSSQVKNYSITSDEEHSVGNFSHMNNDDTFGYNYYRNLKCYSLLQEILSSAFDRKNINYDHGMNIILYMDIFYHHLVMPAIMFYDNVSRFIESEKVILINEYLNNLKIGDERLKNIAFLHWITLGDIREYLFNNSEYESIDYNHITGGIYTDKYGNLLKEEELKDQEPYPPSYSTIFPNIAKFLSDSLTIEVKNKTLKDNLEPSLYNISSKFIKSEVGVKYTFKINDDSMSPELNDGDSIIVKKIHKESENYTIEFGKIYLIEREDNGLKNYYVRKIVETGDFKSGFGVLKPLNPDWQDSEIKLEDIKIFGKVISVIKNYN